MQCCARIHTYKHARSYIHALVNYKLSRDFHQLRMFSIPPCSIRAHTHTPHTHIHHTHMQKITISQVLNHRLSRDFNQLGMLIILILLHTHTHTHALSLYTHHTPHAHKYTPLRRSTTGYHVITMSWTRRTPWRSCGLLHPVNKSGTAYKSSMTGWKDFRAKECALTTWRR
jgi:hypothetical protein